MAMEPKAKRKTTQVNRGFCVRTRNGHFFDPSIGIISEIDINDIAHALSNICRYSGHCEQFYSVAEHSVLVSRIIRQMWPDDLNSIWAGLLHDATEAYVGDVTTPLKVLLPGFMALEDSIQKDIAHAFKIKWDVQTHQRVKMADMIALSTEARLLFADVSEWDSIKKYEPMPALLRVDFPTNSAQAKTSFLREFRKVQGELQDGQGIKKRRSERSA